MSKLVLFNLGEREIPEAPDFKRALDRALPCTRIDPSDATIPSLSELFGGQ